MDYIQVVFFIMDFKVDFDMVIGIVNVVVGVDIYVKVGEMVVIVGESGLGKSQIMMVVMGLLVFNGCISGVVFYYEQNILGLFFV